jgi:hypothetical protein
MKTRWKKILMGFLALFVYVGIYMILSGEGRYREMVSPNWQIYADWHPVGCFNEGNWKGYKTYNISLLGLFYLPGVLADQHYIHKGRLTVVAKGEEYRIARISKDGMTIEDLKPLERRKGHVP